MLSISCEVSTSWYSFIDLLHNWWAALQWWTQILVWRAISPQQEKTTPIKLYEANKRKVKICMNPGLFHELAVAASCETVAFSTTCRDLWKLASYLGPFALSVCKRAWAWDYVKAGGCLVIAAQWSEHGHFNQFSNCSLIKHVNTWVSLTNQLSPILIQNPAVSQVGTKVHAWQSYKEQRG